MQTIPFFSLSRQWKNLESSLRTNLELVLASQHYINGSATSEFEEKLAHYVGARYAVGCNSGTDALWLALKSLNLSHNQLVLTTPFSFIASSSEIAALGGTPIFIDIDPATYNISAKNIAEWLEVHALQTPEGTIHATTQQKITGIVTVNIFGQCADYPAIRQIADEWKLWIVEDAAQSIGSSINSQRAGTLGDVSCFSFYPTKNLGAFGDAGAITTNREDLFLEIKKLRNHGRLGHYEYQGLGRNSRLDSLQAAVLNAKLPALDGLNERRRELARLYDLRLHQQVGIAIPHARDGYHTFHQYCIQVADSLRDQMRDSLAENGIGTNIFYPADFTTIPFLNLDPRHTSVCPRATQLTKDILALPIWPEMTNEEVMYVCDIIELFYAHHPATADAAQMQNSQV